jgi:hypothetical protein
LNKQTDHAKLFRNIRKTFSMKEKPPNIFKYAIGGDTLWSYVGILIALQINTE